MATGTDRLERLTNLVLALLQTHRPLTLREIGRQVAGYPEQQSAIRQAFERDKRTLRDSGIPITVERIGGEEQFGYRILPEDYYLPELDLTDDERSALVLALVAVRVDGGMGADVVQKLGGPSSDVVAPLAVLPSFPALAPLQQAIRERAVVTFSFRGRRRKVEGYGLIFRNGRWYFVGRDVEVEGRAGRRSFRVDRLDGIPSLGPARNYEVPADVDLSDETDFSPFRGEGATHASVRALVSVDARDLPAVVASVGEEAIRYRADDGSATVEVAIDDEATFDHWAIGLGDGVEVLEPPEARARIIARLRALVGEPTRR
ncbi:MAG: WYL domain-containing protein [Acidimicrobiales bacterium]